MTMEANGRRVTSNDVAREAGVSQATVSYVMNNKPHQKIPEATRQRVFAAAARLGYAPSAAARALRSGRSDMALCLLPDWPISPAIGTLIEELSAALAAHGLTLVVHPRTRNRQSLSDVWKTITPAAVIGFEPFTAEEEAAIRAAGVELTIALLDHSRDFNIPEQRIGRLQAEHLAATGHRRLGYAFPDNTRVHALAQARLDGVRHACADLGLDDPVVRTIPLDPAEAAEAVQAWRADTPAVTGICAFNDNTALAILAGLRQLHLSAPHDLAVIGVDDIPAARLAAPPLTTVRADQRAIASHLAATIGAALSDQPAPPRPGSDIIGLLRRESA
jgi:DNA-binding LacI/PurR family transcriptional regulator